MRHCALLALLIFAPLPTFGAGHADWSFEVLEVSEESQGHRIRLRPLPPGREFPRSCPTFVVYSHYDLESWSEAARESATRTGHERAILALVQAQATNAIIRFGSVGIGFAAIVDADECEVVSRGLTFVVTPEGSGAVYSVFEQP